MRRFTCLAIVVVLVVMMLPTVSQAQEDDTKSRLTETFVASDESFSFMYPEDWELSLDSDIPAFSVEIEAHDPGQDGTVVEGSNLFVSVTLMERDTDATLEDAANTDLADMIGLGGELTGPDYFLVNDKVAVQLDVSTIMFNITDILLELDEDTLVKIQLTGTSDQIANTLLLAYEILGSVRLSDDTAEQAPLHFALSEPESYESDTHGIGFEYPADWEVSEGDSYVLVTAPSGVSIGLSYYTYDPAPEDVEDIAAYEVQFTVDNTVEQIPTVEVGELLPFELNEQHYVRVAIIEPSEPLQLTAASVQFGDATVGNITFLGSPYLVGQEEATFLAIIGSLHLLD
jgi:hypothetical protein